MDVLVLIHGKTKSFIKLFNVLHALYPTTVPLKGSPLSGAIVKDHGRMWISVKLRPVGASPLALREALTRSSSKGPKRLRNMASWPREAVASAVFGVEYIPHMPHANLF